MVDSQLQELKNQNSPPAPSPRANSIVQIGCKCMPPRSVAAIYLISFVPVRGRQSKPLVDRKQSFVAVAHSWAEFGCILCFTVATIIIGIEALAFDVAVDLLGGHSDRLLPLNPRVDLAAGLHGTPGSGLPGSGRRGKASWRWNGECSRSSRRARAEILWP